MKCISHTTFKTLGGAGLLAVLFVCGCSSNKKSDAEQVTALVIDSLFSNNSGDVRGYALGSLREEFDIGDGENILANEKEEIVEHINLNGKDSSYIEVYYRFENDYFTDAEINVFLASDTALNACADSLNAFFTKKFGKAVAERGVISWKGKGKKGYPVEVYITDRSFELNESVLLIQMHCDIIEEPVLAFRKRF